MPLLDAVEEAEHPMVDLLCGLFVVGRQAAVGEQVTVARVEEQLGIRRRLDERAGGVHVALPGEEGICVHAVDLDRGVRGPGAAELRDRDACLEQRNGSRTRAGTLALCTAIGRYGPSGRALYAPRPDFFRRFDWHGNAP